MERTTDSAFSVQEAERVREQAAMPGTGVVCPRCGGRLSFHGPVPDERTRKLRILARCATCRRYLVSDLPGDPLRGKPVVVQPKTLGH